MLVSRILGELRFLRMRISVRVICIHVGSVFVISFFVHSLESCCKNSKGSICMHLYLH